MARRLYNPSTLHPAPGYSHIAESSGERLIYFAGQVALDLNFGIVGDDIYSQTIAAMRNVKTAMDEVNVEWDDIVRCTVYTLQPTAYEAISRAIDEVTGGAANPPQTIIGVTGVAIPGLLIEIECTAVAQSG
jgi:enamine deaminase RidA (YjgF/YER057c/UK114 family)